MCWRQDYSVFQGGKICKFLRARGKRKWPCVDLCDGDSFPLFSSHGNDLSPFSKNPISALAAELLPGMGYLPRRLGPNNCFTPNLVRCRGGGWGFYGLIVCVYCLHPRVLWASRAMCFIGCGDGPS